MARRKSYSREFKLEVVRFYHNSNLSNTTKQFELNSKTVLRWVKQEKTLIACFGPTTAQAIEEAGLRLDIKAPTKTAPSMTMAIEEYIQKNS